MMGLLIKTKTKMNTEVKYKLIKGVKMTVIL